MDIQTTILIIELIWTIVIWIGILMISKEIDEIKHILEMIKSEKTETIDLIMNILKKVKEK